MALAAEVAPVLICRVYCSAPGVPAAVHDTGWGAPVEPEGPEGLAVRLSDGRLMPL